MTKIAKFSSIVITAVEGLVLGALVILELLSGYRGGIMQHLYYKKIHYLSTIYDQDYLIFHLAGLIICLVLLGYHLLKKQITPTICQCIPFVSAFLLIVFCSLSPFAKDLNIYAYLLIYLETVIVLETFRIILYK